MMKTRKPICRKRWTKSEIRTLKKMYRTRSNQEIAEVLFNRSISSIVLKAYSLGLSKGPKRLKEMGRENESSVSSSKTLIFILTKLGGGAKRFLPGGP